MLHICWFGWLEALVVVNLFILSGCAARYPDALYACGEGDLCPRGFRCIEGLCRSNSKGGDGSGGGSGNTATNEPITSAGGREGGQTGQSGTEEPVETGGANSSLADAGSVVLITSSATVCANQTANQFVCDGRTLFNCSRDSGAAKLEECESASLCEAGTKTGKCGQCEPNSYRCDDKTLQK
jgi:hypothetical protein